MSLEIRDAAHGDAAVLALLGRLTFCETFRHLFARHPDDLAAYLEAIFGFAKIERSLAKPENHYWIALINGLPVGYAKLKSGSCPPSGPDGAAQLQKIYILRDFLALGIGRPLLDAVMAQATVLDAPLVWLSVLQQNRPAIGFYGKHGFHRVGTSPYAIGAQTFDFELMARPSASPVAQAAQGGGNPDRGVRGV